MTEPLPQRPFTALPPPPDGMAQALRDGRRLRLRRRLAGAGAAALSVAVVAGATIVLSGSSTGASDTLVPAAPPSASTTPSPGGPEQEASSRPSPAAAPSASPDGGDRASQAPAPPTAGESPAPGQEPAPEPAARPAGTPYRTPDLVRAYRRPARSSGSGRICSGGSGDTGGALETGLCRAAYAPATSRGHDLVFEACADSTGPATLHYDRALEAELVVRDAPSGRTVWRWSAGHSDLDDPHVLQVEQDGCWTWTALWTDVDAGGVPLEPGRYELVATGRARELVGYPAEVAAFTVG